MDESLRTQLETYLTHLDGLIRRGREVLETLAANPSNPAAMGATRAWQEDCGVTINQLSGGSKSHWLARSFSQAFLMRSTNGQAVTGAAPGEIVKRLIAVLEQAVTTLSEMEGGSAASASVSASTPASSAASVSAASAAPAPRRFEFVHNADLKPVLEQAYTDSRQALEQQDYELALRTSCGILEAIVTDALEHQGQRALAGSDAPAGKIGDWPFQTRLAVAERTGLIRGGCARLPAAARTYRDHTGIGGENGAEAKISERDARIAGQVLHVVMRDLDPGR
jgi:hypothetical protein